MPYSVVVRPGFYLNLGGKTINTIGAGGNTTVEMTDYEFARDVSPSAVSPSDVNKPIVTYYAIAGDALAPDTFTYNPDGSVATATTAGVTTSYTYNADGSVNTESRQGKTKTYIYDSGGNVTGTTVS